MLSGSFKITTTYGEHVLEFDIASGDSTIAILRRLNSAEVTEHLHGNDCWDVLGVACQRLTSKEGGGCGPA